MGTDSDPPGAASANAPTDAPPPPPRDPGHRAAEPAPGRAAGTGPASRTDSGARTAAAHRLLVAAAVVAALGGVAERVPQRRGEAAVLRWLRVWPQHPVRSTLALALGLHALLPSRSTGRGGSRRARGAR